MASDLLAFGKPILVLGDPGQLPPIKDAGAFTHADPDVMLTEIHRQAGESAIIRLATMARQGIEIPAGEHDAHVWKLPRNAVTPAQMLRGGQVICGRNSTRLWLNSAMKAAAGFAAPYPAGLSEKIICLKNRHDLGLVNGMFVSLGDVQDEGRLAFTATVTTEDGARDRRPAPLLQGPLRRACAARPGPRTAGLARAARADRDLLGLRHHLSQVSGKPVGERHRLRRSASRAPPRIAPAGSTPPSRALSAGW